MHVSLVTGGFAIRLCCKSSDTYFDKKNKKSIDSVEITHQNSDSGANVTKNGETEQKKAKQKQGTNMKAF